MKIEEIINKLCSHEISKAEAIDTIKEISDGLRKRGSMEFNVGQVSFRVESNDGILLLRLPYGYDKIKGRVNINDKVDVSFII